MLDSPKGDYRTERPPGARSGVALSRRRPGGHGKSELGAAAGRPAHGDRAAVRLDQALDDVQAEAGTAAGWPLRLPPRGLPRQNWRKTRGATLGRDALALVADGHGDRARGSSSPSRLRRLHHDGHGAGAVPDRVLHQVAEDLVDLVGVQPGLGQLARAPRAGTGPRRRRPPPGPRRSSGPGRARRPAAGGPPSGRTRSGTRRAAR